MQFKPRSSTTTHNTKPSLPSLSWHLTTFDELSAYQIYNIIQAREQVFVKDQHCAYVDADGRDFDAMHLSAYDGEPDGNDNSDIQIENQIKVAQLKAPKLLAYCRIIPPTCSNDGYPHIGRVLVLANYRGYGLARQLMLRAIDYCHSQFPKQPIHISAQTYLIDFYQSLGFICEGVAFDEDSIEHIHMILANPSI